MVEGLTAGAQIGGSVVNSAMNGVFGLVGSGIQHRYNKDLADYQNDINIQNWNMQNEYNTPVNQVARLEEAGLNPALMYGNGGGSTGNATQSVPQYHQMGVDVAQNMLASAQLNLLRAQARKTDAEAENQESINPYAGATAKSILDNWQSKTEVNESTVQKNLKDMEKMDVDISVAKKTIEKMNSEISLQIAQAKTEEEKAKLTHQQRELAIMQQGLIKAQTESENARTQQITVDTVIRSMDAQFQRELGYKPEAKFGQACLQVVGNAVRGVENKTSAYANRGIQYISDKIAKYRADREVRRANRKNNKNK